MSEIAPADLKVGIYISQGDGVWSQYAKHYDQILELAMLTEAVGLDSVWISDHMIFDFEGVPIQGRWECWTLLAAIAARTSTVTLGPLVTCTGFRNPALLAKMAETVDEISHGRLVLGLGAGWHEPEFTTYGFPFDHRASRFEEAFAIIDGLITDGHVDFQGTYESAPNCYLRPRGPRPGDLPLMIGTDGPRLLELTAEKAGGWNTNWTRLPEEVTPRLAALRSACEKVGRDPETIGKSACVMLDLDGASGVWSPKGTSVPAPLSINAAADRLAGYARLGIDHVMLWLDPDAPSGVEQAARVVAALRA